LRHAVRPKVTVNCAASIDGKIAPTSRVQTRLSSPADLERVRALRAECDAILVGIGTVLADDPGLLAPQGSERKPLRVVVDSRGRTPRSAKVLDGGAPTLVATSVECQANFANAEVVRLGRGKVDLIKLMDELHDRGVKSLLVEGGGAIIFSMVAAKLVDDLFLFIADVVLGGRDAPTVADGSGFPRLEDAARPMFVSSTRLDGGTLMHYRF
jgi:2,5-diamino-6-(ribosylamino)-4(3H)-pyrimidinone 5'-phosphate reductase